MILGPDLLLSDVLLFSCYSLILSTGLISDINGLFPKTAKWIQRMRERDSRKFFNCSTAEEEDLGLRVQARETVEESLYTADPKRYNPSKKY